jgi:CRISPR/Cas system-associated protein Cas5 (RAMP superfamily)
MARKKNNKIAEVVVAGTAITGAALGAAAVLLSDKKNQQKIKKTIINATDKAVVIGKSIKNKVEKHNSRISKKRVTRKAVRKTKPKKASINKTATK